MTAFAPGFAPGFARFRSTNNQVRGLDCTTAALALYCDYSDLSLSPPTSLRVHLTPSLKIRPKVQFSSQGPVEWNSEFLSSTVRKRCQVLRDACGVRLSTICIPYCSAVNDCQ
eukprot:gene8213-1477_t